MQKTLMKRAVGLVTVGLLCFGGAGSSIADEAKVTSTASDYRIGLEDVLDISVRSNAELDKVVPVRPDGKISLPLVNDIGAAGLTPMELRDALTERLTAYIQNPEVSVVVREIHSFKVSVMGNVRAPGRYDLRGASTVLDVVALAGGFTEFAARRKITILRRDGATQQRLHSDYDAAVKGNSDKNIFVKPGDIIIVP